MYHPINIIIEAWRENSFLWISLAIRLYRPLLLGSHLNGIQCPHSDLYPFGRPILLCWCFGVHRRMLLMSSSLLHQQSALSAGGGGGAIEYTDCRGVRPPFNEYPRYDYLMVRHQHWSFGECRVPLHCHCSQIHSDRSDSTWYCLTI